MTALESLTLGAWLWSEEEDMEAINMMFASLSHLRKLEVMTESFFPEKYNLSEYILTKCSPVLEHIVFHELISMDHIAQLLHGSPFANEAQLRPIQKKGSKEFLTSRRVPDLSRLDLILDHKLSLRLGGQDQWADWYSKARDFVAHHPFRL